MKFNNKIKLQIQLVIVFLIGLASVIFMMQDPGKYDFLLIGIFLITIGAALALYNTFKKKSK